MLNNIEYRDEIEKTIGSAFYDQYIDLCKEAVAGGYDIGDLYKGADQNHYHDFSRVLLAVAIARGAKSYDEYAAIYEEIKQDDDTDTELVSEALFARFSGISKIQTAEQLRETELKNREYRRKYYSERSKKLKEVRLMIRIDENIDFVIDYIKSKYSDLL